MTTEAKLDRIAVLTAGYIAAGQSEEMALKSARAMAERMAEGEAAGSCAKPQLLPISLPQNATMPEIVAAIRERIAHCGRMKRQFNHAIEAHEDSFAVVESAARAIGYSLIPTTATPPASSAGQGGAERCDHCGKNPATCRGAYEGNVVVQSACDECCAHGGEDGRCEPIPPPAAPAPAVDNAGRIRRALINAADILDACSKQMPEMHPSGIAEIALWAKECREAHALVTKEKAHE